MKSKGKAAPAGPPVILIVGVVVLVLAAVGIAYKSIAGGNPKPDINAANNAKPDPAPAGSPERPRMDRGK